MALKRQQDMLATFSMASMTDVVFLLLVFFMVTSAFVFPTALEIDLPQSTQQTAVKPSTRVFIDAEGTYYVAAPDAEAPIAVPADSLALFINSIAPADSLGAVAVYADAEVSYGKVVEVLNIGAEASIKMVLATKPTSPSASTDETGTEQ
ncbi:MAG: biopolymer transporter ExbD [Muribaculaceae bacterium]|nr:biopolymer transporter ExbD [Muribaculaceae bacterium]MDE6612749.1 biopolymer transporter ExbD [Muribaculaceae bacterium]